MGLALYYLEAYSILQREEQAMRISTIALTIGVFGMAFQVQAEPNKQGNSTVKIVKKGAKRLPLKAAQLRGTSFNLERYHSQVEVVRLRTAGKDFATFVAEPQLLDRGSVMIFEIRSVAETGSVKRWSCVAQNDIAECLGKPVRVRYLPADEKVVLIAKLKPLNAVGPKTAVAKR